MSEDVRPSAAQRWHDLDAVRAFALLSGVALHGVMSFMAPRIWLINDPQASAAIDPLFYVIHIFRMTLFFVLAGFFARLMIQKKGVLAFAGNRLKRIALPLVVFWPLILAAIIAVAVVANPPFPGAPAAPPPPALSVATFPLTHLWFLYVLLVLYAGAIALKLVTDLLHIGGLLGRMLDAVVGGLTRFELIGAVLAVPVAVTFYTNAHWMMWFGIATPDTGLVPNAMATAGFVTAFAFGWWLNRNPDLLDHLARRFWSYGFAAAVGTWWCLHAAGTTTAVVPVDGHAHPVYAILYPATTWAWTLGLIGAAHRFLKQEAPVLRYLADASYWIYIVHLPLVLLFQWLVMPVAIDPLAKLAVVVLGTMAVGLLSYQLGVRYTFIGTILNGRKRKAKRAVMQAGEALI